MGCGTREGDRRSTRRDARKSGDGAACDREERGCGAAADRRHERRVERAGAEGRASAGSGWHGGRAVKILMGVKRILPVALLALWMFGSSHVLRAQEPGDTKPETAASKQGAAEQQ